MQKLSTYIVILTWFFFSFSCKDKAAADPVAEKTAVQTPVTVTTISSEPLEEYVDLNANSTFLLRWMVKANATGYLQSANVQLNMQVSPGQTLYTIKTKEAQIIGSSINILDSTFKFSGVNSIKANQQGFISQINHVTGDYVLDGEQLATITDSKSFVFLLDMPYELRPYVMNKRSLELVLPDGEKLTGTIGGNMPTMDATSQTQPVILKVNPSHPIPENLIAKVRVVKATTATHPSLPKAAVLSDETQSNFWVMKLIDSTTAVKVPIQKGIETKDKVEIISPPFTLNDKIIITGNYGLADTAKVKIIQQ